MTAEIIITITDEGKMQIMANGISGPLEARILLQQADQALMKQLVDESSIEIIPPHKIPRMPFGGGH